MSTNTKAPAECYVKKFGFTLRDFGMSGCPTLQATNNNELWIVNGTDYTEDNSTDLEVFHPDMEFEDDVERFNNLNDALKFCKSKGARFNLIGLNNFRNTISK